LYHKKSSHNEKRRGENERLIAISDNVEFLSRLSLSLSRFSFGTESEDTDERGEKGSFLFGYFFARRGSRFINNMNTNSASSSGTSHRDQKLRVWWIKIVLCRSFREFFFLHSKRLSAGDFLPLSSNANILLSSINHHE
jgi:hypothetical protein